jgi:membrane protein YqaA with SNARE-associated domain
MTSGAIGSASAGVGAAPGAVVGARIGALIGDVTGWWVGMSIAERVYDWIFTELEKEEYEVVCAKN